VGTACINLVVTGNCCTQLVSMWVLHHYLNHGLELDPEVDVLPFSRGKKWLYNWW